MRAKAEAEKAKKALSVQQRNEILWSVNVPDVGMIDVDLELTRDQFEKDIRSKLEGTIDLVETALRNQMLTPDAISAVLLAGGSTAIPKVRALLSDVFGEKKIRFDVNPMECVALGAALRADTYQLSSRRRTSRFNCFISYRHRRPFAARHISQRLTAISKFLSISGLLAREEIFLSSFEAICLEAMSSS
jgi:cell division ATPase FtsA